MLTHPDPHIQALLNDIAEQRDVAMVAKVNFQIEHAKLQAENATLKAELDAAKTQITELTPAG